MGGHIFLGDLLYFQMRIGTRLTDNQHGIEYSYHSHWYNRETQSSDSAGAADPKENVPK